jgi:hypothetical protein
VLGGCWEKKEELSTTHQHESGNCTDSKISFKLSTALVLTLTVVLMTFERLHPNPEMGSIELRQLPHQTGQRRRCIRRIYCAVKRRRRFVLRVDRVEDEEVRFHVLFWLGVSFVYFLSEIGALVKI